MAELGGKMFQAIAFARSRNRWANAARQADKTDLSELRVQRQRARQLRRHLDELIHVAESRLALPMIGSTAFRRPHGSDWGWRPELWRGPLPTPGLASVQSKSMLGSEVTLFHDCDRSELTLRQLRNRREQDLAPFGLRMDVFRFDGSFLSLVVDLPPDAVAGLKRRHLIRMNTIVEMEKPLEIFARLNIRHGPNTEQIVRELPLHEEDIMVEFDLAYSNMNEKRVEKAWIDLIFEGPEMNQVVLRDLTFSRRPRAEL
ncbi:MAG: DUF6478 family protein [Paracoccaceae bacterium]|jgi:hypothetical protein|uniref:DUF6478 family protein n=1 Tax=unclassified Seohaeicola TaxID=2641111 RepID=UPI00237B5C35|nr:MULTISPECIES: DUF6478 family protein [unclassified Seohaeicola]MDD9705905.1 DUF6478 family protein [Seohaeicola sp. 4SK31]MDD9736193.1 DUF6478 family protein [Seohaeicola sp. SP36]MDM7969736.1 DUF6478 family protein [Paracoccaceae bacterium]